MKLDSLEKLLFHELKDLHSAERQLVVALPKMASAAQDGQLAKAFRDHLKETEAHIGRLDVIFKELDVSPRGHKCKGMEGLIAEASEIIEEDITPDVLDAALISAAQRVEHYEMAGYGTARAYADKLGMHKIADVLQLTLNEEGAADRTLTTLAERSINFKALVD